MLDDNRSTSGRQSPTVDSTVPASDRLPSVEEDRRRLFPEWEPKKHIGPLPGPNRTPRRYVRRRAG